ncbi:hypothetical protein [Peptoniphilus sp. HCN-40583]|uniref:hypothetical protein n=1 Tax=Peptoniphilus sp. HCN-40583 TaxID=3134662 RepID=UPI0030BB20F2
MKNKNKTPTYNLTWAQIEQIKKDAKAEVAAEVADDIGDGRISLDDITGALEEEIGLEFTWREK